MSKKWPSTGIIPAQLVGVAIETHAEVLLREAQTYQAQWFDNPNSAEAKERFASALLRWAEETRNRKAKNHALALLGRGS